MHTNQILLEVSPWLILLCLLMAFVYAYLLYSIKRDWPLWLNRLLFSLRFLTVGIICFLLLNPIVNDIFSIVEKPKLILAVDDSKSINLAMDSMAIKSIKFDLKNLEETLSSDYELIIQGLKKNYDKIDEVRFNEEESDLYSLLSNVDESFESKSISAIVLLSDGIYNKGRSPIYTPLINKLYTVGLGDTIQKKDLSVNNVFYNKIVFEKDKYPVNVELLNEGTFTKDVSITILDANGKELASRSVKPNKSGYQQVDFFLDAKESGLKHYTVEITSDEKEFTSLNNKKDIFFEILEGSVKVLFVTNSPHPDIKAIKSSLEKNKNYLIDQYIPEISDHSNRDYDVAIIYQKHPRPAVFGNLVQSLKKKNTSFLFLIDSDQAHNSDVTDTDLFTFKAIGRQKDQVIPSYNPSFKRFKVSETSQSTLEKYPPMTVPYGNFTLNNLGEILLYQKKGSITTKKPLLIVSKNENPKEAYLMGIGLWRWKHQEYAENENTEAFDELVSKLIQYLSLKEDARRFKFYPTKSEYKQGEEIIFNVELYNDIYENIYGNEVEIEIEGENGIPNNYSFVPTALENQFKFRIQKKGVHKFSAKTSFENNQYTAQGNFSVAELQLEPLELTARHGVLKRLAQKSGGSFYNSENITQLIEDLGELNSKSVIKSNEAFNPLIYYKWMFFLILLLITTEWVIRRYQGSY